MARRRENMIITPLVNVQIIKNQYDQNTHDCEWGGRPPLPFCHAANYLF